MLRLLSLVIAALVCLELSGCGGENKSSSPAVDLDVSAAAALFEEDVRRSFDGSYYVSYDLEVEMEDGETHNCTLKWWKDGTYRQRFDMCPPLVFGDDFEAEPWRILMFGDREQILVCSSRLPLDPEGELDAGEGACHEDGTGIGDLAGNAVYALSFPLEYPDALPPGYFDRLEEIQFMSVRLETIAGRESRCYVAGPDGDVLDDSAESMPEVELCFDTETGARTARSGKDYFEYRLRAVEIGAVSEEDFALPYPYVDAEID